MNNIKFRIVEIIKSCLNMRLDNEEINLKDSLSDIGIQSKYYMKILVDIEKGFGIVFDDQFIIFDGKKTLEDFIRYVEARVSAE
jgi:acyl carrier protein